MSTNQEKNSTQTLVSAYPKAKPIEILKTQSNQTQKPLTKTKTTDLGEGANLHIEELRVANKGIPTKRPI